MFGIGMPEMILILAIALIVIGPKKLPELAKSLGRAMREFKKATSEFKESIELNNELQDAKQAFDDIKDDVTEALAEKKVKEKDSLSGSAVTEKDLDATSDHLEDSETKINDLKRQQGGNEKNAEETAGHPGVEATDESQQLGDDGEHKD
jgi:TatA/E family protein of Tat protein translocase